MSYSIIMALFGLWTGCNTATLSDDISLRSKREYCSAETHRMHFCIKGGKNQKTKQNMERKIMRDCEM